MSAKSKPTSLLPRAAALAALIILAAIAVGLNMWIRNTYGTKLPSWVSLPPNFFGDVISMLIALYIGWGAWPSILVEIIGRVFGLSLSLRLVALTTSACFHAIVAVPRAFSKTSITVYIEGLFTYLAIYMMSWLIISLATHIAIILYRRTVHAKS